MEVPGPSRLQHCTMPTDDEDDDIQIRLITGDDPACRAAADIMASAEPWITYGRNRDHTYATVSNPQAESYAAVTAGGGGGVDRGGEVVGVAVLAIKVPLISGYIAGLAVKPSHRNRGIGTRLLKFAEQRIFRDSPNVFICATSFNDGAQRLYARLGYRKIGEIADFAVAGAHEHLLRKTLGPQATFKRT